MGHLLRMPKERLLPGTRSKDVHQAIDPEAARDRAGKTGVVRLAEERPWIMEPQLVPLAEDRVEEGPWWID
ncbi:unnamed protein product [Lampetra fluviatilis]